MLLAHLATSTSDIFTLTLTMTMATNNTAEEILSVQAKAQLDSEKPHASSVPSSPLKLELDSDKATKLLNLLTDGLVSIRDEDGRFLLKRM